MISKEYLNEHYNNIFTKNKEKILKGGEKVDYLPEAQKDKRMSIMLLSRILPDISKNI